MNNEEKYREDFGYETMMPYILRVNVSNDEKLKLAYIAGRKRSEVEMKKLKNDCFYELDGMHISYKLELQSRDQRIAELKELVGKVLSESKISYSSDSIHWGGDGFKAWIEKATATLKERE